MAKYQVRSKISHDGKDYKPGDKFEANEELAAKLIAAGALVDPATASADDSGAEARAEQIVADAKAEAEKILSDAEAQAAKVAEAAKADADKAVADAKAEAEKIRKAAQAK